MDKSQSIWKVQNEEVLYVAPPWINLSKQTIKLPNGKIIDDYYHLELPDFVATVAMTRDDRVLMLRQYKHGAGRVTLTLPSGMVEPGEAPLQAAQRELREETGFQGHNWRSLGAFTVHGNLGAGKGHYFRTLYAEAIGEPCSGDLEEMETILMSRDEIGKALACGDIGLLNHAAGLALAGIAVSQQAP